MMNRKLILAAVTTILVVLIVPASVHAQQHAKWDAFRFLLGTWVGDDNGEPGVGSGRFTMEYDLQKEILVRKNFADFPATKDKPALSHDDLTIIYLESDSIPRAIYFDNEGHVIHYTIEVGKDGMSWVFFSPPSAAETGFRLTYLRLDEAKVKTTFEIAPPGKPFLTHVEATAHRIENNSE